ncbi:MAG TPA: HEAT repeat domain-containing protein [Candidatus Eisenbacteria bacterium]
MNPLGRALWTTLALVVAGRAVAGPPADPAARSGAAKAPAVVAPAADPMWLIARAEDQREWSDGVLQHFLGNADPAVRARAALAVGRLQDSATVSALLPLLRDADPRVRAEAVFALGQIGERRAREPLEKLLAGAEPEIVDLVIEALGKLGDRAATPAVAAYLRDASPRLRAEAAVALWRLADSTAIDRLIERHDDPDPEVRWRVLWALERVKAPDRVSLIVALHLDDPSWLARAYAARTLGRQKSRRATAYLLQKLDDPEPGVIVNVIAALQQIADSTSGLTLAMLNRALDHPHPYVRLSAATAMAERFAWAHPDSGIARVALDTLASRLHDRDAATRGEAARALLARRGTAALPLVTPLLSDSSVYTRAAVLRGLSALPAAHAAPLLLQRLRPGHPLLVRMTAAEVLGALRHRPAAGALREALADTALLVAASAASALADLGDAESIPRIARAYVERARDADADARITIRDALRTLAGRAYADSVERAAPPRAAAANALEPGDAQPPAVSGAVLRTTAGDITWAFYPAEAPQTVRNFVRLAEAGYFNGLAIHRVVPNFVIQDGDPTGTGSGGPGYSIRCEYNRLRYDTGMVGMALSGKDTGGSQWFITHSPQPRLDGHYTIFARVTAGMDVVGRVVQGDRVIKVDLLK